MGLALSCSLLGCKNENESVTETCSKVETCGGVVEQLACETSLEDMIGDGRISQERASTCAVCMSKNDCEEIKISRHCDTACKDVSFVETLFTSEGDRKTLCNSVASACSEAAAPADKKLCPTALRESLETSPSLDQQLNQCALCVALTKDKKPGKAEENKVEQQPLCARMTTRCREACASIGVVAEAFAKDEAARAAAAEAAAAAALARETLARNLCNTRYACEENTSEEVETCSTNLIEEFTADTSGSTAARAERCVLCLTKPCEEPTRLEDCQESCSNLEL